MSARSEEEARLLVEEKHAKETPARSSYVVNVENEGVSVDEREFVSGFMIKYVCFFFLCVCVCVLVHCIFSG